MNQHNLFPKRLTVFALAFLGLVLGFGLFSVVRTSELIKSFSTSDVPVLQLSCAATRLMGEAIDSLEKPNLDQSQIRTQLLALDDSMNAIITLTADHPSYAATMTTSANYHQFKSLLESKNYDSKMQGSLEDLKVDLQTLIENYLFKKQSVIEKNIQFGYISAVVSLIGAISFFILIYFIYTSYQRNVADLIDVTQRLEKERLSTIQSSKLASLGEMAAGLAHEINNPLAVIVGRCEILLNQITDGSVSDREVMKTVTKISEMANRISKIVTSMRKVAKSSGHAELTTLSLSGVIEDVLNLVNERIRNNSITLDISEVDPNAQVQGNFTHLSQVIINLLNNGVDELNKMVEGERNIWLKTSTENEFTYLKIIDSGPGVPDAIRDKLFEPFFTTKEVGKGTGLGLSISKTLMADMGGDLLLEKDAGRTAFVLKLTHQKT